MRVVRFSDPDFAEQCEELNRRAVSDDSVKGVVEEVMQAVRAEGDAAVFRYTEKFDGAVLNGESVRVPEEKLQAAWEGLEEEVKALLGKSHENVTEFAKKGLREGWQGVNTQGAEVGERYQPIPRVGIYVPGGSAPLVSSVLMTVSLAKVAGVPEIVVCTPCGADLQVNETLLAALYLAGADEVYQLGGAQAIAAMTWGTESVKAVEKLYGPGNRFVVEAKRQAFGVVGVDLLPGPSEILILADGSAEAAFVAADMLAQAEHGGDSQVCLVTTSEKLLGEVEEELERQAKSLSRGEQLQKVLEGGCVLVLVEDLEQGIALGNAYAAEHVSLVVEESREEECIEALNTSGAIFVGNFSPVAVGDFLAGPSHELPTGGAGKAFPGLTVDQFQRRTSVVKLSKEAVVKSAPLVEQFSALEGLDAHGRSATIRA